MEPIIRTIRRYTGSLYAEIQGERAVLVSVHRGETVLRDDGAIGDLQPGDVIEFALLMTGEDEVERLSCVTSEAHVDELGAIEGEWMGLLPTRTAFTARSGRPAPHLLRGDQHALAHRSPRALRPPRSA